MKPLPINNEEWETTQIDRELAEAFTIWLTGNLSTSLKHQIRMNTSSPSFDVIHSAMIRPIRNEIRRTTEE